VAPARVGAGDAQRVEHEELLHGRGQRVRLLGAIARREAADLHGHGRRADGGGGAARGHGE